MARGYLIRYHHHCSCGGGIVTAQTWGVVLVLCGLIGWALILWNRKNTSHMRRQVIRWQHGRISGNPYKIVPWGNSGWGVVAIVVLVCILVLVLVGS